jgi:hypothetical protein
MTGCATNYWTDPIYRPYRSIFESYIVYEKQHYMNWMERGEDLEPLKQACMNFPSLQAIELYLGHDDEESVAKTFFFQAIEEFGP